MVKLAIDTTGGDYAPTEIIKGCDIALERFPNLELVLYGDETVIKEQLKSTKRVSIIHAPKKMDMGEQDPINSIRKNRDTALVMAFQAVRDKTVEGVVTAGPTQGVVPAAHLVIRRIKGMKRVALCPVLPPLGGKNRLLLDVGANLELRSEHLLQLAQYASIFLRETAGIKKPLIGLLNVGTEEGKGRELENETYDLLKQNHHVNFYGNIEGKEIFTTPCDILITDGFTGNMVMKTCEGVARSIGTYLKDEIKKSFIRKIGYLFMKGVFNNFKKVLSPDEIGGANLFGVDGIVVKAHGSSNAYAFSNAIYQALKSAEGKIVEKMKEIIAETGIAGE